MARAFLVLAAVAAGCVGSPPRAPVAEGMQALEGTTAGACSWRLWTPAVAPRPLRLAIWLHPSQASGEQLIEPLAPLLSKHGYALLVPIKPRYLGWTSEEIQALFSSVIPDVARASGVDPQLPLVIGFSAGGQMALHLWQRAPDALGAVVLVGTIPALVSGQAELPVEFPPRALLEGTAVLSLVGGLERGAQQWTKAAPAWLEAGVPLTLTVVPARAHEWLFDAPARALLDAWLQAIGESSTHPPPGG